MYIPDLVNLYETAGGTLIVRVQGTDERKNDMVFILALTDPSRFGPSSDYWPVEILDSFWTV